MAEFLGDKTGTALWLYISGGFVFAALVIGLMMAMPARNRRPLVAIVTFAAGLFYSVEFFWVGRGAEGDNPLSPLVQPAGDLILVLAGFALGLGTINLFMVHGRNVQKQKPGWHNSGMFFVAFLSMLVLAFLQHARANSVNQGLYNIWFNGMLQPLGATMFAVLAFFIVSASYRAFRIKSGEATLMMIAAFIVMLGQVPIGAWLTGWLPKQGLLSNLRLEDSSYWILTIPNMAAQRGIDFGIGVGMVAMALRIWLSLEKGSFFDKEL
jgi:hypothetical protein